MANYTPSNLVKAQARYTDKFTEAELRSKVSPALMLGMTNGVAIPNYEQLKTRDDRTVSTYMKSRNAKSTGTGRVYNHAGSRGDSHTVDLAWTTISNAFSISLKQLDNNVFAWEEAYAHEVFTCALDIHEQIETNSITHLKDNRTQVNSASVLGSFQTSGSEYAYEVANSNREQYYQIARAMMRANNYRGQFDMISNQRGYVDAEKYMNQGTQNATNLSYQFQGLNVYESIELSDANYAGSDSNIGLIMPAQQFVVLPWIPKQNRIGQGDYFSYVGGFGSIPDPTGSGLDLAMHAYMNRADTSSENGDEQDVELFVELSVDIAYALPPLSESGASVVHEIVTVA